MNKLRTVITGLFVFVFMTSTNFPILQQSSSLPHITFENIKHDFGKIYQNANGKHTFKFTNTGKEPLIIQNVGTSCGCTVAKKPNAPILPGDTSEIDVKYDTRRIGDFHKSITITSNADNSSVTLYIKGEVLKKPKEEVPEVEVSEGFTPVAK